jgi:hypothetical protein
MALQNTIYLPVYRATLGEGKMKKVQQGVASDVLLVEQADGSSGGCPRAFVHEGVVYMPHAPGGSGSKFCRYSKELGKFERIIDDTYLRVPLGEYIAVVGYTSQRRASYILGPSVVEGTQAGVQTDDYTIDYDTIWALNPGANLAYKWQYPFSGAVTQIGSTSGHAITEHNGDIYIVKLTRASTQYLRKWNPVGGSWTTIGSGFTLPRDNDNLWSLGSNIVRLFSFGGKLYLFIGIGGLGQLVGCYELDVVNGDIETDLNNYIPAAWKGTASYGSYVDYIRDASGSTEQMFLLRTFGNIATSSWEIYEFYPSSNWSLVHSGIENIWPVTGALYNEQSRGAFIRSVVDTTPSNYATLVLTTADRYSNGGVNIDPRYRNLTDTPSQPAPYNQCTEKAGVGSEGKTGLSSKPTGIAVLSDLSDDFSDDLLDSDLWEPVCPGLGATPRDFGVNWSNQYADYTISETGGELRFGSSADAYTQGVGAGVKSKWFMSGAFQVDFRVSKIANLVDNTDCRLYVIIKTTTNRGYGFCMYKVGGVLHVYGLYMAPDTDILFTTASVCVPIDGAVVRISRNASNVWTIMADIEGLPEDRTPAGSNYSEDAQIWMFCCTHAAAMWSSSTEGPGIEEVVVSGAGSLGRYDGAVEHNFMWDHITDLGANKSAEVQTYIDVD